MNQKERTIIAHMRKEARTSLSTIADSTKIPLSTAYDKINKLYKSDIIKKSTILLDFEKMGWHTHHKLIIKLPSNQHQEFITTMTNNNNINSIHETLNDSFFIETIHKNVKEFHLFKNTLQDRFTIKQLQIFPIIQDIVRENSC